MTIRPTVNALRLVNVMCMLMAGGGWCGEAGATRYGEALHPGPGADRRGGGWEQHGCARFRCPQQPGFHHALMDEPEDCQAVEGEREMSLFTLGVETCNATSWGSAKRYLRHSKAGAILLQEHHLPPQRTAEASAWALKHGWHSLFLPAEEGTGAGWRAGVAILARPHMGLTIPHVGPVEVVPSRVIAASIEPPGYRRCTLICAYLEDGKGVSPANLQHLGAIGSCVQAQGENVPCIAGGGTGRPPPMQSRPRVLPARSA